MIDAETQQLVVDATTELWEIQSTYAAFLSAFQGKERGHRIADLVEELTVTHLEGTFDVKHELRGGSRRARSMGDLWLGSSDMYNPINVKAGVYGVGGQPNLVSLAKLTEALLDHLIDSYYLLFVKFTDTNPPKADVELINLLGYLEFVHFDSGTGQMMLRADRFMKRMETGESDVEASVSDALARLLDMRREGDQNLAENRAKKLAALEKKAAAFDPRLGIDQRGLELG